MRHFVLILGAALIGQMMCGCEKGKKESVGDDHSEKAAAKQQEKEMHNMGVSIKWLGHSSFRIAYEDTIIYIDPWKVKGSPHDANAVLVSHSHFDHYSSEDIAKVSGPDTKLLGPGDVVSEESKGETILPGLRVELADVSVIGVPAYNTNKKFHPQSQKWLGFVVEIGGKRIYYAGDSDATPEMKNLTGIDVAILPIGGTYTMNAAEAAEVVNQMKPRLAIPCHWGDVVGGRSDADRFAKLAACEVKILSPGETVSIP
jgi:L-ascorbate metabolism protein UlaG (beta-lactamase superfamily)